MSSRIKQAVVLVLVYESEIEEAITVLLAVLYFYLTSSVGVKTIPQAIMRQQLIQMHKCIFCIDCDKYCPVNGQAKLISE